MNLLLKVDLDEKNEKLEYEKIIYIYNYNIKKLDKKN